MGSRTEKRVWRHGANAPEHTAYAWSGMQMVGEESDARPETKIQHVYEEGGFTPLARVESFGASAQVYWYHAELNGLPERMTDAQGETVWRGAEHVWVCGGSADVGGSSGVNRCSNFVDKGKLTFHFNKHSGEFRAKTEGNYLNIGRDIIKHEHKTQYNYKGELGTDLCSFNG